MGWFLAGVLFLLAGCTQIKPLKPGGSSVVLGSGGQTNSYNFSQPENPGASSEQNIERTIEEEIEYQEGQALFNILPLESWSAVPHRVALTNSARLPVAQAMPKRVIRKTTERVGTSIGAAQKDTGRDLSARLKNMRAVQITGIALVVVALAFLYFKWPTPATISGIGGLGMIVLAQVLPGNEALILFIGVGVVIGGIALVLFAWNKGKLDQYLPDSLDRNLTGK